MTVLNKDFTPAELDLYVDQGDDFSKIVTLQDENQTPLDLTGFTFTAVIKEYFNSSKGITASVSLVGLPVDGRLRVSISSTNSQMMVRPRYVYTVRGTNGIETIRVLSGQVLVNPMP